ncbi:MAG: amidohydrolase family protein [Planctomycetota bacterium]|jgi:L-fuconolactonase
MALVIDSHQHYWDLTNTQFDYGWLAEPQHAAIHKSYLPADLAPHLERTGVDKTVFVQTQHNLEENRWVLGLMERYDFIAGMVGWVDLTAEDCEDQLAEFKDHPKFVGIRHIVQDEPDDDFILEPDVLRGLKTLEKHGVPYDLLFYTKHFQHTATVAHHAPDLKLVVDHLSKPQIKDKRIDNWAANLKAAADCPNVYCKLSGMITEADWEHWTAADLKPYVHAALEAFGPERCMFGSDWPVCELAGTYQQVIDVLNETLGAISQTERDQIFGKTAAEFYGLDL